MMDLSANLNFISWQQLILFLSCSRREVTNFYAHYTCSNSLITNSYLFYLSSSDNKINVVNLNTLLPISKFSFVTNNILSPISNIEERIKTITDAKNQVFPDLTPISFNEALFYYLSPNRYKAENHSFNSHAKFLEDKFNFTSFLVIKDKIAIPLKHKDSTVNYLLMTRGLEVSFLNEFKKGTSNIYSSKNKDSLTLVSHPCAITLHASSKNYNDGSITLLPHNIDYKTLSKIITTYLEKDVCSIHVSFIDNLSINDLLLPIKLFTHLFNRTSINSSLQYLSNDKSCFHFSYVNFDLRSKADFFKIFTDIENALLSIMFPELETDDLLSPSDREIIEANKILLHQDKLLPSYQSITTKEYLISIPIHPKMIIEFLKLICTKKSLPIELVVHIYSLNN